MPRKARLTVPGAVYHVMARCLPMYQLFSDNDDRELFLGLLATYLERTGSRCYAWVLMGNHYHLVIRSGPDNLWRLMKPMQMRYAQHHSRKTGRKGPLFMDRYKSIAAQDQNYLQELVRYVHLNPIRAGVCKTLHELLNFPWCGHSAIMGKKARPFLDTATVLRRFGKEIPKARKAYLEYLREGLKQGSEKDSLVELIRKSNKSTEAGRKPDCWVIGNQKFVKMALDSSAAQLLRVNRFEQDGGNLERLAKTVCNHFQIKEELIRKRHRGGNGSEARKAFAYMAARGYKVPIVAIASFLGIGSAAVSAMANAGECIVKTRKITM